MCNNIAIYICIYYYVEQFGGNLIQNDGIQLPVYMHIVRGLSGHTEMSVNIGQLV